MTELAKVGVETLWLTPMTGEVFMDKGFIDKLSSAERSSVRKIAFYTNFVIPSDAQIRALKHISKLTELHISLYGADVARFVLITAKPAENFERLVRNLASLATELQDWPNRPRVFLELREGLSFREDQWAGPLAEIVHRLRLECDASLSTARQFDTWGGTITPDHLKDLDMALAGGETIPHFGACIHVFCSPMITATDEVVACGCRGIHADLLIGDVAREPLHEVLSRGNVRWRSLVEHMNAGEFPSACRSCSNYRSIWDNRWARGCPPKHAIRLQDAMKIEGATAAHLR